MEIGSKPETNYAVWWNTVVARRSTVRHIYTWRSARTSAAVGISIFPHRLSRVALSFLFRLNLRATPYRCLASFLNVPSQAKLAVTARHSVMTNALRATPPCPPRPPRPPPPAPRQPRHPSPLAWTPQRWAVAHNGRFACRRGFRV